MKIPRRIVVFCLLTGLASVPPYIHSASAADGFAGVIYFRDGNAVRFNHVGDLKGVFDCRIYGMLKSQRIRMSCHEVKEIHFADANQSYADNNGAGDMIVVNADGERFVLENAILSNKEVNPEYGLIHYTYNDPITKKVQSTYAKIKNTVSHIVVDGTVGRMKYNPSTKEYFPALYNYDPFTGEKLQWGNPEP